MFVDCERSSCPDGKRGAARLQRSDEPQAGLLRYALPELQRRHTWTDSGPSDRPPWRSPGWAVRRTAVRELAPQLHRKV